MLKSRSAAYVALVVLVPITMGTGSLAHGVGYDGDNWFTGAHLGYVDEPYEISNLRGEIRYTTTDDCLDPSTGTSLSCNTHLFQSCPNDADFVSVWTETSASGLGRIANYEQVACDPDGEA